MESAVLLQHLVHGLEGGGRQHRALRANGGRQLSRGTGHHLLDRRALTPGPRLIPRLVDEVLLQLSGGIGARILHVVVHRTAELVLSGTHEEHTIGVRRRGRLLEEVSLASDLELEARLVRRLGVPQSLLLRGQLVVAPLRRR